MFSSLSNVQTESGLLHGLEPRIDLCEAFLRLKAVQAGL